MTLSTRALQVVVSREETGNFLITQGAGFPGRSIRTSLALAPSTSASHKLSVHIYIYNSPLSLSPPLYSILYLRSGNSAGWYFGLCSAQVERASLSLCLTQLSRCFSNAVSLCLPSLLLFCRVGRGCVIPPARPWTFRGAQSPGALQLPTADKKQNCPKNIR